jgi:hypothetical protein
MLAPLTPAVRPMFGCQAVYVGIKIMLVMRHRADYPEANGIWMATEKRHHASLKKLFPSMRSVYLLSGGRSETNWQMLPEDDEGFEAEAGRLCELLLAGDERIGRVPGKKKHP